MSSRFSIWRAAQHTRSSALRVCCVLIAVTLVNVLHSAIAAAAHESSATWSSTHQADRGAIQIYLYDKPFITYSFRDSQIPRPYCANAYTPSGAKITRNHPPAADDPQDHDKMHPGMWLAFGDLSDADSWRLAHRTCSLCFSPAHDGGCAYREYLKSIGK